jgi:hypothetical protein
MGGMNEYVLEVLVADHLRASRAAAARHAVVARSTTPLRVALGHAMIRLGRRLATRHRDHLDAPVAASRLAA